MFGEDLAKRILLKTRGADRRDVITTVTEFTALSIYDQYLRFVRKNVRVDELIVSGGGAHNAYLMDSLRRYFSGARVRTGDETALPTDAKEAIAFAILANETLAGNPSNVPKATGARKTTVLGKICLP